MNKFARQLIRLGYEQPELRPHLRPVLDKIASDARDSAKDVLRAVGQVRGVRGRLLGGDPDMAEVEFDLGGGVTLLVTAQEYGRSVLVDLRGAGATGRNTNIEHISHLDDPVFDLTPDEHRKAVEVLQALQSAGHSF